MPSLTTPDSEVHMPLPHLYNCNKFTPARLLPGRALVGFLVGALFAYRSLGVWRFSLYAVAELVYMTLPGLDGLRVRPHHVRGPRPGRLRPGVHLGYPAGCSFDPQ
jgi:hypothetical protein